MVGAVIFFSGPSFAEDDFTSFTNAKNSFDAGQYDQAAERFKELENKDLHNDALLTEVYKYLGVTYLFLGKKEEAKEQFILLLNSNPDFQLDPLVFPIDAVDFFTEIKIEQSTNLKKITEAKKKAEEQLKIEEERQRQIQLEKLRTTVYVEKEIKKNVKLVSFIPFGAGQFQNEERKKALFFLSSELSLSAVALITFALHESLRKEAAVPFYVESDRVKYEKLEKGFRIANTVSFITLGAVMLWGIVDAMYFYTPYSIKWKTINEKDVPDNIRKKSKKTLSLKGVFPVVFDNGAGLGFIADI
jgi:tetratricopeptide (TPR) repeat protein